MHLHKSLSRNDAVLRSAIILQYFEFLTCCVFNHSIGGSEGGLKKNVVEVIILIKYNAQVQALALQLLLPI